MVRIGLIGQNHLTGIGIQSGEFARNMGVEKVLVTDLSKLHADNSRNAKRVTNKGWFNSFERMTVDGVPDERACKWLLDGIDVLYVIETPLNWEIFRWAREKGVKSCLAYNAEFFEYFNRPNIPKPDVFLAPTKWGIKGVSGFGKVVEIPVPTAADRIKRRDITQARKFVHITGFKAHLDRNGTDIVKESMRSVGTSIEVKVFDQTKNEVEDYWDLYKEGDVLILPRRYGGLSLQLQEATMAGMPVIVTEHDPYAGEPSTVTIPGPYHHVRVNLRGSVDCYSASPQSLGQTITELSKGSIKDLSDQAYEWAQARSWDALKPRYEELFEDLCSP